MHLTADDYVTNRYTLMFSINEINTNMDHNRLFLKTDCYSFSLKYMYSVLEFCSGLLW